MALRRNETSVKEGDVLDLRIQLTDERQTFNGSAFAVKVLGRRPNRSESFSQVSSCNDSGEVVLSVDDVTHTAKPGTWLIEVELTAPGNKPQTFPDQGYLYLYVRPDLG